MQDRIKELAKQCGIDMDSDTLCRHGGWDEPMRNFAQSVARDCINEFQRAQYRSGCDVVDGKEVGRFDVGVIGTIRARFGITE